jgi:outer membrane protein insertion porin family
MASVYPVKLALLITSLLWSWPRVAVAQEQPTSLSAQSCDDLAAEPISTLEPAAPAPAPDADAAPALDATAPVVALEAPPVQWTEWSVSGTLLDSAATLRAVLEGAMQARRALTKSAQAELAAIVATMGYHLVGLPTHGVPGGGIAAVLELAPRAIIRSVRVTTDVQLLHVWQSFTTVSLDDEVERRMRLRAGTYVPWNPAARACEILREKQRIADYLHDEGFFEATVDLSIEPDTVGAARVRVQLTLGPEYQLGKIRIDRGGVLTLSEREISNQFKHQGNCLIWKKVCVGPLARFTRAQHQNDLKQLIELYQRRGFPAVRVQSDFDPKSSFDRRTKAVNITLRIDERRRIDVVFEGHDPDQLEDGALREQLTFDQAGSADDVEANDSAQALTTYLQGRGYFEARVTWKRERFRAIDQLVFRIALGPQRRVRRVEFAGNHVLSSGELTELIATRPYGSIVRIFGNAPPVSAKQLDDDAGRIIRAYRQHGYRNAKIELAAGPTTEALGSVALNAAQISSSLADGDIYVRFTIDEGRPTFLRHLEIHLPGESADGRLATAEDQALCDQVLRALSRALDAPSASRRLDPSRCFAAANVTYREERVDLGGDAVRDLLRSQARPQSEVELKKEEETVEHMDLSIHLRQLERRRLGNVLLRGNFRTRSGVVLSELGFVEGAPLTADMSSEGQRRLRATGLFESVNITYVDGDGVSHAVVQVEERYDHRAQIDLEGGVSTVTGSLSRFIRVGLGLPNLFGTGVSADAAVTWGSAQFFVDTSLRIPRFLVPRSLPISFDTTFLAFFHEQDTDRFGNLQTKGLTAALSRSWQRNNTPFHPARALSTGLRYDFRLRDRQVESIRPAGPNSDQSLIPVSTISGALALTFEWEQRVTRGGALSPLAPEAGFRLQASVALASPYLLGQDTFLKLGGSAQVYWPLGRALLVRTDLRYDHGVPLSGEVVLPEVERFFAGGDSTVRGYDEDRLATEIIGQDVPPFGGAQQLRVVAAGGNIRAIASVDAQLTITGPLATALFVDAGVVTNDWRATKLDAVRPGTGMAVRAVLPFGAVSLEYAIPLRTQLGDDPRGRIHFGFAMRFD